MRVLMFANPLLGHLLPMFPLARALRQQGHTVAFATARHLESTVEPHGFALISAGPTTETVVAEVTRHLGADWLRSRSPDGAAEFFAGARIDLGADEALAGARAWAPDVIVSEHCDFVGPLVAAALKIPSVAMAIDPTLEPELLTALAATAHRRYLERGLEPPAHAPCGQWLLDLCPPSLQRDGELPALHRLALRPEPHQAPEGAPRAPRATLSGRPRVLVSFSTAMNAPERLGSVLRSLSTLDVDLVATASGGMPIDSTGLDPDRVELVTFLPAAELLDGVSVVVHHGGSGTTFGAAARGIPAAVVPGMPGQRRQAARLEAAGAGLALPMGEETTPEAVTAAVGRLLAETTFTTAAHRLRDEIAAMPSAAEVADHLVASVV
ncbi:glycosyltransferase [Streptomyces sp. NPDC048279]|uniref:glycosyltransferase n=1 Tax=Streptomyces sp. NPDC048279 TaxID=3154714 RepID=UPI00342AF32C